MRNTLKVIRICDNEFRVTGEIELWVERYKSVEIDGETYTALRRDTEVRNVDDYWGRDNDEDLDSTKKFRHMKTDFMHYFGLPELKMSYWQDITWVENSYYRSENSFVNYIQLIKEQYPETFPYRMWTGKRDRMHYHYEDWNKNKPFDYCFYSYGFNNGLWCSIPYQDILKLNLPSPVTVTDRVKSQLFPTEPDQMTFEKKSELLQLYIDRIQTYADYE